MQKDVLNKLKPASRNAVPYTPHTKPPDLPTVESPRVWNIKAFPAQYRQEANVYIGRGGPWGNPYIIGVHGNRDEVIDKHAEWLEHCMTNEPELINRMKRDLAGRHLICHCAPLRCHGDILLQLVNPSRSYAI
jgi:hypothetical protein